MCWLLDFSTPDSNAREILATMRGSAATAEIRVITVGWPRKQASAPPLSISAPPTPFRVPGSLRSSSPESVRYYAREKRGKGPPTRNQYCGRRPADRAYRF